MREGVRPPGGILGADYAGALTKVVDPARLPSFLGGTRGPSLPAPGSKSDLVFFILMAPWDGRRGIGSSVLLVPM